MQKSGVKLEYEEGGKRLKKSYEGCIVAGITEDRKLEIDLKGNMMPEDMCACFLLMSILWDNLSEYEQKIAEQKLEVSNWLEELDKISEVRRNGMQGEGGVCTASQ